MKKIWLLELAEDEKGLCRLTHGCSNQTNLNEIIDMLSEGFIQAFVNNDVDKLKAFSVMSSVVYSVAENIPEVKSQIEKQVIEYKKAPK